MVPLCGACCQAEPQKTTKTSAALISGPLRYVSCGPAAAACTGLRTSSGTCRGTILMESPCCREDLWADFWLGMSSPDLPVSRLGFWVSYPQGKAKVS